VSWRSRWTFPVPTAMAAGKSPVPTSSAWPVGPRDTAAASTDSASAIATMTTSEVMPFEVLVRPGAYGGGRRANPPHVMEGRRLSLLSRRPLSLPSTTVIPATEGDAIDQASSLRDPETRPIHMSILRRPPPGSRTGRGPHRAPGKGWRRCSRQPDHRMRGL